MEIALRSPLFVARPPPGPGEPPHPTQSIHEFLDAHNEAIAAGRLPTRLEDYLVLLLSMANPKNPREPFPARLLRKAKDFAVFFFRGMPVALLAKNVDAPWRRHDEQTMESMLAGIGKCPWVPSRANIIVGLTSLAVEDSPHIVAGGTLVDPGPDEGEEEEDYVETPHSAEAVFRASVSASSGASDAGSSPNDGLENEGHVLHHAAGPSGSAKAVPGPTGRPSAALPASRPSNISTPVQNSTTPSSPTRSATWSWVHTKTEKEPVHGRSIVAISTAGLADSKDSEGKVYRNLCKIVVKSVCQVLGMAEWLVPFLGVLYRGRDGY